MFTTKKLTYLLLIISIIATGISCKTAKHSKNNAKGIWQAQPIVIDGNSKDWPSPYPSYDPKALIGYAYSNDKDNLYLTIETGDEMTQLKILRQGLTIWIDTGGGKKKETVMEFPMENSDPSLRTSKDERTPEERQSAMMKEMVNARIKKMLADVIQVDLQGFYGCNGTLPSKQANNCGITVAVALDEYNELIWEAAIPFKAILGKDQITAADKRRVINVGYGIKGLRKPTQTGSGGNGGGSEMNSGGSGMNMRGGGGMRGAGMHGGGSGKNGADAREHLFENTNTWVRMGLEFKS